MSWFIALLLFLKIVGGETDYTVQPGDSLTRIGARFGVDSRVLAEANGLKPDARLQIGQVLRVDNRHIVPDIPDAQIIINVPQRMLFYFEDNRLIRSYPVAAGRSTWKTPMGDFTVDNMRENPTWYVPVSIQEEMRRQGKPVVTTVPPSAENPLGKYWIGLSLAGIGIHGTNAPASIYGHATHGCNRLHPEDIEDLYARVIIGMSGSIVYEPVLVAREGDSVFLEVHPDTYKLASDPFQEVIDRARAGAFLDMIDFRFVQEVIRKRDGVARDVTRR